MKGVTIIHDEDKGRVQVAPAGDVSAFRLAAAKASEAGPVRTVSTAAGIGLDMDEGTARRAGFIATNKRRGRRAAQNKNEE